MHDVGRRLRELRSWRRLTLREAADLAGISYGYLGKIERGEVAVDSRSVLESLARALRVAPTELTAQPFEANATDDVRAAVPPVVDALTGWSVGEAPDARPREWPELAAGLQQIEAMRSRADFGGQLELLPTLIRDLLVAASAGSPFRRDALVGLISAYKAAAQRTHDVSYAGVPTLAAERMRQAAELLDDPTWTTYANYQRAHLLSAGNRPRQYDLAVRVADTPGAMTETRGMANLTAALAAAVQGDREVADTHLSEAAALAETIEPDVSTWGATDFGRTNVGIWRVAIGVEMGDGPKVAEVAEQVRPTAVSRERQAAFWIDLGRGWLSSAKHRDQGIAALLNAEQIGAQKLRSNVFAREAVADQLRRGRPDSFGRELRGLAWRMGVAPTG